MILSPKILKQIDAVRQYAEAHPVPFSDLMKMSEGVMPPIGDTDEYTVIDGGNFKAVFSIEEQPIGLLRHISVSTSVGVLPDENMMSVLTKAFGFKSEMKDMDSVWREEYAPGAFALNAIEIATYSVDKDK